MADLLARMGNSSARRAAAARAREPEAALRRRALDTPPPPALALAPAGFDLITEFKRRAPSAPGAALAGALQGDAARRAMLYAGAGAAAVSILTEPDEFGGRLEDLAAAARAVTVPVLRKDFLVSPYQVMEARAAGAGGVLLILRLLDPGCLAGMIAAAGEMRLFVLLETFDEGDIDRAGEAAVAAAGLGVPALVGVNTRDLATLAVDRDRLGRLAPRLPAGRPWVAESGLSSPEEARLAAALGYRAALVGGALMRTADPEALARAIITAGREEAGGRCASA